MSVIASASIVNDISYTLIQQGNSKYSEAASLNYSQSFTSGVNSGNINYGVVASGSLGSGEKYVLDFSAINKEIFDVSASVSFDYIKGVVVQNHSTVYGNDLGVHATGTAGLTEIFNGGSGNLLVKPYSVYQYADPISGVDITATGKELTLEDVGGNGLDWSMIVVGVTG